MNKRVFGFLKVWYQYTVELVWPEEIPPPAEKESDMKEVKVIYVDGTQQIADKIIRASLAKGHSVHITFERKK
jgi:hypothetical protein